MMQSSRARNASCRTVIQTIVTSLAVKGVVPGDPVHALLMRTQTAKDQPERGDDQIQNNLTMSLCDQEEVSQYNQGEVAQVVPRMNLAQLLAVLSPTEIPIELLIMRAQLMSLSQKHPTMKDLKEVHTVDQMTVIRFQLQPVFL